MVALETSGQSRTHTILHQAFGAEFDFYLDRLKQPDSSLVIKLGGMIVDKELEQVTDSVLTLTELGIYPTLVHGGGPQIDRALQSYGIEPKKIAGNRVTDSVTLDIVSKSLSDVNHAIFRSFSQKGIPAQSFTEGIFSAKYLDKSTYGYVGDNVKANIQPIGHALNRGVVPIVSCFGATNDGQPLNINGDSASSALADRLYASNFVTLTEAGGVLDERGSIIPVINLNSDTVEQLVQRGIISEGMLLKVRETAAWVIQQAGNGSAVITSVEGLLPELFTHEGRGTLIRKGDRIMHHASIHAVNHRSIRELINSSFEGGVLRQEYFRNLPESAEVFTTEQSYDGVAIVLPGENTAGQPAPAYLDKIAVRPGLQGHGIGKELIDAAIGHYEGGLFWRTKTRKTKQVAWYSKIAQTRHEVDDWTVFTVGVTPEMIDACVQKAVAVEPSVFY